MKEHTDGPWTAHPQFSLPRDHAAWVSSSKGTIALCDDKRLSSAENLANATLIAAAPDLLAALHIARIQISADFNTRIHQPHEKETKLLFLEVIEDAIKKAQGGEL